MCCASADCLPQLAIAFRLVLSRSVCRLLCRPSSLHSHRIHRLRQCFVASNRARWLSTPPSAQPARPDGPLTHCASVSMAHRLSSTSMPLRSFGRSRWPPRPLSRSGASVLSTRPFLTLLLGRSLMSWTPPSMVVSLPSLSGSSRTLLGEYSSPFVLSILGRVPTRFAASSAHH